MESTEQILKQDAAGRVWTPRAQREAILDEFERSGLSGSEFAVQIGVKYQTFAGWVRQRRLARARDQGLREAPAAVAHWVEAAAPSRLRKGLLLELPGGARLELVEAGQVMLVAQLLCALQSGGSAC